MDSSDQFPTTGRLAAIDFGTVRIGIALSDVNRQFASPHDNYTRRNERLDAQYFQQLVDSEQIVGFVVGLPVHTTGAESQKSHEARQFARWLSTITQRPIRFHDERYTTREATLLLGEARMTKKKRQQRLDKLAAQLLLVAYLESTQQDREPGSLDDPPVAKR
jgi:putative Holliday junction resolvase